MAGTFPRSFAVFPVPQSLVLQLLVQISTCDLSWVLILTTDRGCIYVCPISTVCTSGCTNSLFCESCQCLLTSSSKEMRVEAACLLTRGSLQPRLLFVIHTPETTTNTSYYIHYSRQGDSNCIKQCVMKQFNKGQLSSNAS